MMPMVCHQFLCAWGTARVGTQHRLCGLAASERALHKRGRIPSDLACAMQEPLRLPRLGLPWTSCWASGAPLKVTPKTQALRSPKHIDLRHDHSPNSHQR